MATFILLWISTTFSSMWSTVQVSSNILCISNTVWSHTECNRLDTMDACVRSGGWVAEQLLQRGSCLPYLSTWSLPLIVINGYDDVFSFIPLKERERKQEGVRKRKWKKESAQEKKKNCLSPVACVLFMSVTFSTDTDIKWITDTSSVNTFL